MCSFSRRRRRERVTTRTNSIRRARRGLNANRITVDSSRNVVNPFYAGVIHRSQDPLQRREGKRKRLRSNGNRLKRIFNVPTRIFFLIRVLVFRHSIPPLPFSSINLFRKFILFLFFLFFILCYI